MDIQIIAKQFYDYSLHIRGYSPATIKRYKYVINAYCRFANLKYISDLNIDTLRALFFHGRTERKWSTNTYIVFYKSLSIFFKWCMLNSYLNTNLIKEEIQRLKKEGASILFSTHRMEQVEEMCEHIVLMNKGIFQIDFLLLL